MEDDKFIVSIDRREVLGEASVAAEQERQVGGDDESGDGARGLLHE